MTGRATDTIGTKEAVMIPTMMVVGLVLGLFPRGWKARAVASAGVAVLASVAFGLLVEEPLAGSLLALANVSMGIAIGLGILALLQVVPRAARDAGLH
jgi:hypothetical protein